MLERIDELLRISGIRMASRGNQMVRCMVPLSLPRRLRQTLMEEPQVHIADLHPLARGNTYPSPAPRTA